MIDLPGRRKRERAQKRLMDVVKRVGVTEGDPGTWWPLKAAARRRWMKACQSVNTSTVSRMVTVRVRQSVLSAGQKNRTSGSLCLYDMSCATNWFVSLAFINEENSTFKASSKSDAKVMPNKYSEVKTISWVWNYLKAIWVNGVDLCSFCQGRNPEGRSVGSGSSDISFIQSIWFVRIVCDEVVFQSYLCSGCVRPVNKNHKWENRKTNCSVQLAACVCNWRTARTIKSPKYKKINLKQPSYNITATLLFYWTHKQYLWNIETLIFLKRTDCFHRPCAGY